MPAGFTLGVHHLLKLSAEGAAALDGTPGMKNKKDRG
jgi:hypothetical protein